MEIDLNVLGKQQVTSTTGTNKMRMSKHAQSMVFQMFTKNVYSNPIGTVVREITSNCFDSHVEAGVKNTPVLIKKTYDAQTDTYYISFIDYGVGMSPDRIENIYSVYFESSKRTNNDEIGGFGIGGKTPLAYKRNTGDGDGEYDNSFFVITNYDGIKYYYNIYEGKESPEYTLFHSEKTDERNGTEIRIPLLSKNITKFEDELVRQLYYFEGIVFEGFSDNVQNDYQIVEGKNFYYRGDEVDHRIHVCLGKVYYPIDYNTLGLSGFDYEVPVAIKVPIGKIGVTVSRESLDYSEQTVKYLKNKLGDVMEELKSMISKQHDNVQTLEDYFELKNNFGILNLTDNKSIRLNKFIKQSEIDLTKFKYSMFKTPSSIILYELFFDTKMYGKKETKFNDKLKRLERSYKGIKQTESVFYSNVDEFKIKRIKQSYLKTTYGRFYLIRKAPLNTKWATVCDIFNVHFDTKDDFINSKKYQTLLEMQEEYFNIVRKNGQEYENVEVPPDFKVNYGREKLSHEILKTTIPIKLDNRTKERVKIKDLVSFKGKIFYSTPEDDVYANQCRSVFRTIFNSKHLVYDYNSYFSNIKFGDKKGIMIITIARNNLKYMKYCNKAYPLSHFYTNIVQRKENEIITVLKCSDIFEEYREIDNFYKTYFFETFVAPEWGSKINEIKQFISSLNDKYNRIRLLMEKFVEKHIDMSNFKPSDREKNVRQYINEFKELIEKNENVLKFIRIPYGADSLDRDDKETLKNVLNNVMSL